MFNEVVTGTNIVYYMMIAIGAIGVLAKAVNQITLRRLVRAAGNMPKSTHKLIKLVRAKYEHALMLHDRVENAEAFVEKYIYEYRGFLLRIHTWRQLELQSIWFSGILAAFGGIVWYMENGFCEQVYRYISLRAAAVLPAGCPAAKCRVPQTVILWYHAIHILPNIALLFKIKAFVYARNSSRIWRIASSFRVESSRSRSSGFPFMVRRITCLAASPFFRFFRLALSYSLISSSSPSP